MSRKPPETVTVRADLIRAWTHDMLTGERSEATHELLSIGVDLTYGPRDIDEAKAIAAMRMLLEACGWEPDDHRRGVSESWRCDGPGWVLIPTQPGLADFRYRTRETLRRIALSVGIDRQ